MGFCLKKSDLCTTRFYLIRKISRGLFLPSLSFSTQKNHYIEKPLFKYFSADELVYLKFLKLDTNAEIILCA